MIRPAALLVFLYQLITTQAQNIPALGTDTSIDAACWNVEWLGDASNGPTNEKLQLNNVTAVLSKTKIDLWALCEVSSPAVWDSLKKKMPGYSGAISTWSQTQKTALLFRDSLFTMIYSRHILAVYEREFAYGRLPLEVALQLKTGSRTDTLFVIVLHLKANTGTTAEKAEAYDLRKRSSEALKDYLDVQKNKKFLVLGDWNDDLDVSIYNNLASPFVKFLADTVNYTFSSKALTLSGQRSTTGYNNMIDHHLMNRALRPYYVNLSAAVFRADAYIVGYATNTSDHYPVWAKFDFRRTPPVLSHLQPVLMPYFDGNSWRIQGEIIKSFQLFDMLGRNVPVGTEMQTQGRYIGEWRTVSGKVVRKLLMKGWGD
jgi:endonuclease/exonuclease/phosphatase family metal-dependent hydrolase